MLDELFKPVNFGLFKLKRIKAACRNWLCSCV